MTSANGVGAFNATVRTGEPDHIVQAAREQRALDCLRAVEHIRQKQAALQEALEQALAETQLAQVEAEKGRR